MGRSTDKETGLSEQRKYRSWTAQQKIEIVLARQYEPGHCASINEGIGDWC